MSNNCQLARTSAWIIQRVDFIAAWQEFANQTVEEFSSASAMLLRDRDEPNRFISAGPWPSVEVIESWRASDLFRDGFGRLRELVEDVQPRTMDRVVSVGQG